MEHVCTRELGLDHCIACNILGVVGLIAAIYAWRECSMQRAWTRDFVSLGISFFRLAALKSS